MTNKMIRIFAIAGLLCVAMAQRLRAQQTDSGAQPGEMILYNGKIITVDDHSFSSQLGTVAQAMHIKDGKILHVGTDAQIRPMAGPGAKVIDLKGRTVIPGIILTHEHPWDWGVVTPSLVKKVLPDDLVVVRVMTGSPAENLKAFPAALQEAVGKAKPGEWIYFIFTLGEDYQYSYRGNGGYGREGMDPQAFDDLDGKRITKEELDKIAPDNPVLLRDAFVSTVLNTKAIEESVKVFPDPGENPLAPPVPGAQYAGSPARNTMRWMVQDVMLHDHYPQLRELEKLSLEWWAGYGMTAFGSNAYAPSNLKVYRDLDAKHEMPIRNMWTWNWRPEYFYSEPFFLVDLASRTGEGTDHLWYGGFIVSVGSGCTLAQPVPSAAPPAAAQTGRGQGTPGGEGAATPGRCSYGAGSMRAKMLADVIKAGGRFVNLHTTGDEDIDNIMNIIITASKEAGMTEEEIRAKRHGFDHGVMWPRPDQVPVMKQFGFLASGDSYEINQSSPAIFKMYGEKVAGWVVPKKRLVDGGVYNTMETDRALPATRLSIFSAGFMPIIGRQGWDGKTYAPDQAVDRQTALKIATIWGAYYLLRENAIGSLEPGKWADFAVLDRDYLTIPLQDIGDTRVLMTAVGGKVVHLVPSLAREIGMQPAGAQVQSGPAARW